MIYLGTKSHRKKNAIVPLLTPQLQKKKQKRNKKEEREGAEMGTIWGNSQYYCCIAIYCQDNNISSARSNTIQYNIDLVIEQYIAISYNVGSDGSRDPKLAGLGSFI